MATILKAGNVATGAQITSDATGILEIRTGTGAGTTAITVGTNQAVTMGAVSSSSLTVNSNNISAVNSLGFRNRIINGDMRIDQRNAGASVTPTADAYTLDRWQASISASSKFSVQQNAGSVTPPAGFSSYLGVTSLSAYSITSTDTFYLRQAIEGFNTADFAWGTASAATVTLSFWVRSSLTGTFGGAIRRGSGNIYVYPFTYTISAANTWEQKTVTIAGPTSTWNSNTTNGVGLNVLFGLGVGATYSGTAGSWQASDIYGATGATSVVGTNGATFYITGVQLEAGSVATPFERRDYGRELIMAQRYCINYRAADAVGTTYTFGTGETPTSTLVQLTMSLPVEMRTTPSLTTTGTASNYAIYSANVNTACSAVPSINSTSNKLTAHMNWTVASGLTAGRAAQCVANANNTAYLLFTAEL
jgi:hypothetical protein